MKDNLIIFKDSIEDTSIKKGKHWLGSVILYNKEELSAICPICSRTTKIYRRKIGKALLNKLILFYKLSNFKTHIFIDKDILIKNVKGKKSMDYSQLCYWGLLYAKESDSEDGNPNSGFYAVTQLGEGFLKGNIKIQKCLFTYNHTVIPQRPNWAKDSDYDLISVYQINTNFNYNKDVLGII